MKRKIEGKKERKKDKKKSTPFRLFSREPNRTETEQSRAEQARHEKTRKKMESW